MTRNSIRIREFPLSVDSGVSTGIGYNLAYEELSACVLAGMDVERWLNGETPIRIKAHIVAWARMKGLIEAHSNDAQIRQSKMKNKH